MKTNLHHKQQRFRSRQAGVCSEILFFDTTHTVFLMSLSGKLLQCSYFTIVAYKQVHSRTLHRMDERAYGRHERLRLRMRRMRGLLSRCIQNVDGEDVAD